MTTAEDLKDCISGEPQGEFEKIGGSDCYVATPSGEYPKDKVVLFLTDAFGLVLNNNLLLSDSFARNGCRTIAPDLFAGDPLPESDLVRNAPSFDKAGWHARHDESSWTPTVDAVVKALKEDGVTRIGTTGYCFGAPPAFYLAFANESHVTVLAHPSRLKAPEDLEKYYELSKAPLLINSCEVDRVFPQESQEIADQIFEEKFAPGYKKEYWDGCTHGFAVRGDLSDPKIKAGMEGAFEASVRWFKKYL